MNHLKKACLLAIMVAGISKAQAQTEATFYTTMGNFTVSLTDKLTPITVDSFIARVSDKFYDGLLFHRVINGFVIQGGDPLGNGTGGPGYTMPDEFDPTLKNIPGALAMANSGPNTNGSQYYINLGNNSSLNNHYTVFGMVTANFSVVQNIGKVPTGAADKPLTDVKTDSIRITKVPEAISTLEDGTEIRVYPNPGTGIFNIDLPKASTKVEIVNMRGQVVYSNKAKRSLKVDLQDQPKGLYIVRISNQHGTANCRILVQ